MKVALVHDDLVQWGGAERVLLALSEIFPDAPIYTSVFDRDNKLLQQSFGSKKIITSFMQKIPGWKDMYKMLLPLYPIAFEQFDFSEYDLVISQTTRFAKGIITKPDTKHICYCHTPPRFLWQLSGEKIPGFLNPYLFFLRIYDQISSKRVDLWIAGSRNCQSRIKKIYQQSSMVLLPFVDLKDYQSVDKFEGDYYLIISRLNAYKKVNVAIEVFKNLGKRLKIVGTGPEMTKLQSLAATSNIEFLGSVSEELKLNLLAGCKGLIVTAEEDFGLTPLEAQACGKGVIAYGVGGVLETVIDKKTGVFFGQQSADSLGEALDRYEKANVKSQNCYENAQKFSKEIFVQNFKKILKSV